MSDSISINHRQSLTLSSVTTSPLLSEDTPDFNFFFGNGSSYNSNFAAYYPNSGNANNFQRNISTRSNIDYSTDDQFRYFKQRKPDNYEVKKPLSNGKTDNGVLNQHLVAKVMRRLRRTILTVNAFNNRSSTKFFDEFVYNIIYSKLLEERLMISNYNDVQSDLLNSEISDSKQTSGAGTHKCEKYNIRRSSNNCLSIRLFPNMDTKYVKNLALMIGMVRKYEESLSGNNRNILILKMITLLTDIKNQIINRAMYSKLLLNDCLIIFKSKFLKSNISLDIIYKRIILKFKEIEIYNDPIRKLNPCLMDRTKIIQYISENIKLQTKHMILNIKELINLLLRFSKCENDPANSIIFHIVNYSRTNKIDLNKVRSIIYEFYYDSVIRNSTTLDILSNQSNTLKLKTMKLPLKTGSVNSPFSSPKIGFKPMGNMDDIGSPEINNAYDFENSQYTYTLLDEYSNELHLIRRFYFVMWIIVLDFKISNKNLQSDNFDIDETKVQKDPDFIDCFNIVQTIDMFNRQHKNSREFPNNERSYDSKLIIFNQLRDMLLNDCKLFNILNNQIHAYLETNNLLTMLEVKTYKNKSDIQQNEKNELKSLKIETEETELSIAKRDLIENLNFICYSISKTQDVNCLSNALTSIIDFASNNRLSKYIDGIDHSKKIPTKTETQTAHKRSSSNIQLIAQANTNQSFDNNSSPNLISSSTYMLTDQTKRPTDSKPLSVITRDLDCFYNGILGADPLNVVRSPRKSLSPSSNIGSPLFKPGLQFSILKVNSEIGKDNYNDTGSKSNFEMNVDPTSEEYTAYKKIGDFSDIEKESVIKVSRKDFQKELNSRIELAISNPNSFSMTQ